MRQPLSFSGLRSPSCQSRAFAPPSYADCHARLPSSLEPGQLQFITTSTYRRASVFADFRYGQLFTQALQAARCKFQPWHVVHAVGSSRRGPEKAHGTKPVPWLPARLVATSDLDPRSAILVHAPAQGHGKKRAKNGRDQVYP